MDAPNRLTPSPPDAYIDVTKSVTLGWQNPTVGQAYELVVISNALNASPYWVTAAGSLSASQQTPSLYGTTGSSTIAANTLTATTSGYQWKVRYLETSSGSWSPWSNYSRLFTSVSPPTVSLSEPNASGTTSNHMRVLFLYQDPNSRSMAALRVKIYRSSALVYDTGEVSSTTTSGSVYSYIVTDYTNTKASGYQVGVLAKNSKGVWSAESLSSSFTATPTSLTNPSITTTYRGSGRVQVDVDATTIGKSVLYQELFRYNPVKRTYVSIASGFPDVFTYQDYFAPLNTQFYYRVLTTATDGAQQSFTSNGVMATGSTWAIANSSVRLPVVVENFSADYQQKAEYMEAIGRTRSVSYRLDNDSREGEMTIHLTADERVSAIASIYTIVDADEDSYINSPYGDILRVRFTSPDISDLVSGNCRVSLRFVEVGES